MSSSSDDRGIDVTDLSPSPNGNGSNVNNISSSSDAIANFAKLTREYNKKWNMKLLEFCKVSKNFFDNYRFFDRLNIY